MKLHHHAALWLTIGAIAILLTGIGAGAAGYRFLQRGGFHHGPLPPTIRVVGGPQLPSSIDLSRYLTRIHNQGSSSSCVAQTVSTIDEITQKEHHRGSHRLSAGYIYDQINGGRDAGSSYEGAFGILLSQGDAPLSVFPHDGIDYRVQPDRRAQNYARPFRFASYRSISSWDVHTIKYELAHGRPIALAIPVYDTFYSWTQSTATTLTAQGGRYWFDHSITALGYSPAGLRVLNSWGPNWGSNAEAILSWNFVARSAFAIVISSPPKYPQKTQKKRYKIHPTCQPHGKPCKQAKSHPKILTEPPLKPLHHR